MVTWGPPFPPNRMTDRHLWNHYLSATWLAVGKDTGFFAFNLPGGIVVSSIVRGLTIEQMKQQIFPADDRKIG